MSFANGPITIHWSPSDASNVVLRLAASGTAIYRKRTTIALRGPTGLWDYWLDESNEAICLCRWLEGANDFCQRQAFSLKCCSGRVVSRWFTSPFVFLLVVFTSYTMDISNPIEQWLARVPRLAAWHYRPLGEGHNITMAGFRNSCVWGNENEKREKKRWTTRKEWTLMINNSSGSGKRKVQCLMIHSSDEICVRRRHCCLLGVYCWKFNNMPRWNIDFSRKNRSGLPGIFAGIYTE